MRIAIVGPPQSGKTTLLRALSGEGALSHYGEDSIERVVKKIDPRLDTLSEAHGSKKTVHVEMIFEEIVSLRVGKKGAFNQKVRLSDCIVGVFREKDQLKELMEDFILQDLIVVEKRLESIEKDKKKGKPIDEEELKALQEIKNDLESGIIPKTKDISERKMAAIRNFQFLSYKPILPILNVESYETAKRDGTIWEANLDLEKEILLSPADERSSLMEEFGIEKLFIPSIPDLVFEKLNLIVFFTSGPKESRAWPIEEGTKAIEAAGKIHSDIERGFIRAEVYSYDDFVKHGKSEKSLKEKGLIRVEGKDYIIKDGDVVYFRFNV